MTLRVRKGDTRRHLTARDRNQLADAADAAAFPPELDTASGPDPAFVQVSNNTAHAIPARSVVGLLEPAAATLASHADGAGQIPLELETRWRNQTQWTGDTGGTFDTAKYWNRYAITTAACAAGAMVRAAWRGRVAITLTVRNQRHTHAEPDPDDREKIRSSWHGTPILWREDLSSAEATDVDAGTDVDKLAEIWLQPQAGICVCGYLDDGLSAATVTGGTLAPSTAVLRVWTDDPTAGWSKSGTTDAATVTITSRDETLDIPAGTYLRARSDGTHWRPDWISCTTSAVDRT